MNDCFLCHNMYCKAILCCGQAGLRRFIWKNLAVTTLVIAKTFLMKNVSLNYKCKTSFAKCNIHQHSFWLWYNIQSCIGVSITYPIWWTWIALCDIKPEVLAIRFSLKLLLYCNTRYTIAKTKVSRTCKIYHDHNTNMLTYI